MDLKMNENQAKIEVNKAEKKIAAFFIHQNKYILLFIFLVLVGYAGYLGYAYIYRAEWDQTKKQEYINSKEKEVVFNKAAYNEAVADIKQRKIDFAKTVENANDIFRLNK